MKLVNYQLQNQMETLSELKSKEFFKEYLQNIIEDTSKPYYQRADYVGLSLNELKSKIEHLSQDITELQNLKKKYTSALDIAKELTAEVLIKNGIHRIDGNIISSLTLAKPSTNEKTTISILDENAVMGLGYAKFSVDTEAIEKIVKENGEALKELKPYISIAKSKDTTPAKVKVNTRRAVNNTTITTDEILQLKQAS